MVLEGQKRNTKVCIFTGTYCIYSDLPFHDKCLGYVEGPIFTHTHILIAIDIISNTENANRYLGMYDLFHCTLYWACDYVSMAPNNNG